MKAQSRDPQAEKWLRRILIKTPFLVGLLFWLTVAAAVACAQLTTPTLSVATSGTPSVSGTSITFSAIISSGPTGTVTFYDGGVSIGTGTLNGVSATYTTSALTAGPHTITAGWAGANYNPVTSAAITQIVKKPTTTTLSASPTTVSVSSPVTLTATVKSGTAAVSPGLVLFCDASEAHCNDMAVLGTAQLSSAGTATIALRLGIGTHKINAVFSGTYTYQPTVSSTQMVVVTASGAYPTSTTLAAMGNASGYTLSGNVTGIGTAILPGSISFLDTSNGNAPIGSATLGMPAYALQSPALYADNHTECYDTNCVAIAADISGDGVPDVLYANYNSNTISVSLGNGDGTFLAPVNYAAGSSPGFIAVGDFNADGVPDLAVTNSGSGNVSVYLGNANGTFQAQVTYATGTAPGGIAVGDLNGDGIADMLVVTGSNTIAVLLGNGDGTFQPKITTGTVYHSPTSVAVADFDGDGILDAAVTINGGSPSQSEIAIFLGNGDGTFQTPVVYAQASSVSIAVADFDEDGIPDLVYTIHGGTTAAVMLGNGDGTFEEPISYAIASGAASVAIGDFNLDGIPDIVVPTTGGYTSVLIGNGDGTFQPQIAYPGPPWGTGVAVADLNGDGLPDVVTIDGQLSVQLNAQVANYSASGISFTGAIGTHNVQASYGGNSSHSGSLSNTVALTSINTTPTLSISTSGTPSAGGTSVTFTAMISGGPSGSVTFYDGNATLGSGTIASGMATYTTSALSGGTHAISAGWAGNTSYSAVKSSAITQTVTTNTGPAAGIIITVAGNGSAGFVGNNVSATALTTELNGPQKVAVDTMGNFYISDYSNNVVRKVSASGTITTVAGSGVSGYGGDGGSAISSMAKLNRPYGVAVDTQNNLYIADTGNHCIRMVTALTGVISTFAGQCTQFGFFGDGQKATSALLYSPEGVAVDTNSNIYIADTANCRIRMVSAGSISTVAGNGSSSSCPDGADGGLAINTGIQEPWDVAVDSNFNLYIVDGKSTIREVSAGYISTVAGTSGVLGYSGDTHLAKSATLASPRGVAVDASGNIYIADTLNSVIRAVTAYSGVINTVAGNGVQGYSGDGVLSTSTELNAPWGVAVDGSGNVYIADGGNNRIRKVGGTVLTPTLSVSCSPSSIIFGSVYPVCTASVTSGATGTVSFTYNGIALASIPLVSGSASVTLPAMLGVGTTTVVAAYGGDRNYATASGSTTLIVSKATPTIAWALPSNISQGTALSGTQLNASSNPTGTFTYSPALGTVLPAGLHILTATLTPADSANYNPVTSTTFIAVTPAGGTWDAGTITLKVNGTTAASTTYGQSSTPTSVAAGLAAGVAGGSPVTVTAVDDAVYLEAKVAGATAYNYSLQTNAYDSTHFSQPSFLSPPVTGALEGGANANAAGGTVYSYQVPSGKYDGAGNILQSVDSVMGTWNFTYDSLNRLAGATDNQAGNPDTNYCWGYDPFGNRTIQSGSPQAYQVASPTCTPATGAAFTSTWATYNANNQITGTNQAVSGDVYDAAGDVLNDGVNQYLYDGEGRICAVLSAPVAGTSAMTGYVYDAAGGRVSKGSINRWSCDPTINGFKAINDYVLGLSGEQVTEMGMNASGMAWQHTNVYAGEKLLATYDQDGLHFYVNDPLGTRRAQTDFAGVMEQTCSSLPFGDGLACSGSTLYPTEHHFTGKERDSESGNDYFGARYYASNLGRWLSPDKPLMDQQPSNPQSWNLYSYTRNNPILSVDSNGEAVKALTELAVQRIQSTLPSDVRSQVTADKSGMLNRVSIDAIKSADSNVAALKQMVDADQTVEVTAAQAVQGGQPSEVVGMHFEYQSVADQQAIVKAAGGDPSGITIPNVYDGYTQTASESPSGNVRVTVADGTGATATEPAADLASVTAHELYGHALPLIKGQPWQHDNGGPVDKNIEKIQDHTKELNQKPQ